MARTRIAFVMGKQGSGKTSRILAGIEQGLASLRLQSMMRLRFDPIRLHANTFNHIEVSNNELVLVAGMHEGRRRQRLCELHGRHVIELPHSGYVPPRVMEHFNAAGIHAHVFAIELDEETWRGIGGSTGAMTSPDYFLRHGPRIVPRSECDYPMETARIRSEILLSGIPFTYSRCADEIVQAVRSFLMDARQG